MAVTAIALLFSTFENILREYSFFGSRAARVDYLYVSSSVLFWIGESIQVCDGSSEVFDDIESPRPDGDPEASAEESREPE